MNVLDSHFPGSFGELNHSKRFANGFGDSLLAVVKAHQIWDLHTEVRALQIPSDFVRVIDGITPCLGESFLIHVLITVGRDGAIRWHLLDLTPQGLIVPFYKF